MRTGVQIENLYANLAHGLLLVAREVSRGVRIRYTLSLPKLLQNERC